IRPPSKRLHHEIGWSSSTPSEPSPSTYVDSSIFSRTWPPELRGASWLPPPLTTGLTLLWKLYHSSVRTQRAGRPWVDGSVVSSTTTVAVGVPAGWSRKYAPVSWPYQGHVYSVSVAEWMPT